MKKKKTELLETLTVNLSQEAEDMLLSYFVNTKLSASSRDVFETCLLDDKSFKDAMFESVRNEAIVECLMDEVKRVKKTKKQGKKK